MKFLNEKRQGWFAAQVRKLYRQFQWRWLFKLGWKPLVAGEKIRAGAGVYIDTFDKKAYMVNPEAPHETMMGIVIQDSVPIEGTKYHSVTVVSSGKLIIHPLYLGVGVDGDIEAEVTGVGGDTAT